MDPVPRGPRLVLVTFPDAEVAASVARTLVERRLIACANLLPGVRSLYAWKGAIQDEAEHLAILKTTTGRLPALEAAVSELHPYDVPEFVVVEPARVEPRYLAWLRNAVEEGVDGGASLGGDTEP